VYVDSTRSVVSRVFNLRILSCFPSFRIYRETLSRFSCAAQHPRLILQSNIQTENLRQTLQQLNYEIIDEIIMKEKGHIYEIVVAEHSTQLIELSSDELKFGPKLLNNKNEYFIKKWQRELEALYHIKSKLNTEQHHQRLAQINDEIAVIERVL
ncbi:tRNA (adenine(22)-N(1))-methyltransferase TrmK, partial [Staphylococcus aureus]|uniref:tRNA (adenine(22)-N(1))-methyltransferase TrmK n=1 Tax=Staphylococcus aureus TaxID=1280 RepID=UPI004035FC05